MKLVRVMDLIGVDIAGLHADVRSRNADGTFRYSHQEKDGPLIVVMKRVHLVKEAGRTWLQWEWEKLGHNQPLACGYSGIVVGAVACGHSGIAVGPEAETYYIEIEERNGA